MRRPILRQAAQWLSRLLLGLVICTALLVFIFSHFLHWRFDGVFTGSMEPAFKVGGVVVIKPVDPFDVQVGEVITYRAPISSEPMITHRVVGITGKTGSPRFFTKGDANESVDGFVIPQENIVGRVWLYIPLFGHLVRFVKTPIGLTLFLVVPGALLLWIEGKNIIHRVKRRAEKESA